MLEAVKLALRVTSSAYDAELESLISAGLADLGIAGVETYAGDDELIRRAVITYVKLHFGTPTYYDRILESYRTQKAQLMIASGYTDWGERCADI